MHNPASKILQALRILVPEGDTVEIRTISADDPPVIRSGVYDDLGKAAKDAWAITESQKGVYFTLNSTKRTITNALAKGKSTEDEDITRRRWLLIDIEGERPQKARCSATDEEVQHAVDLADQIHATVLDARPLKVMSGNGCHLLYQLDLPNTPEVQQLIKRALKGLAHRFDSEAATVDTVVHNASRISKLPGTWARKGMDVPERPHRIAEMLSADVWGVLPEDVLNLWASWVPAPAVRDAVGAPGASGEPAPPSSRPDHGKGRPEGMERARHYMRLRDPAIEDRGGDSHTLATVGHLVRGFALMDSQAMELLCEWNERCKPPWTEREFRVKIANAHAYGDEPYGCLLEQQSASFTKSDKKPYHYPQTDLGNAELLHDSYGHDLRWCEAAYKWFVWRGTHWDRDKWGISLSLANKIARDRKAAAKAELEEGSSHLKSELQHAKKSEQASGRDATLKQAKSLQELSLQAEDLDLDPWLLNVQNGTLDLRQRGDGQPLVLREHRRGDKITKVLSTTYQPDATCPRWEAYLDRVMDGDKDLVSFLQRAVGYSLTGSIREQVMFIFHGHGQNGKSLFLETLDRLLEGYAITAKPETFMSKQMASSSGANPEVAMLQGARFVKASETSTGGRMDESLVKQMTGGDAITARFLNQDFFTFVPTFKIFLATNHKPEIRGADQGIWRRIRLVPWQVQIPEEEMDQDLNLKLREEFPGILAWAVRGCLDWQQKGLAAPESVLRAGREYREEMDLVQQFLDDRCRLGPCLTEFSGPLYAAFVKFSKDAGIHHILTQTAFGLRLKAKGFDPLVLGNERRRSWKGLQLNGDGPARPDSGGSVYSSSGSSSGSSLGPLLGGRLPVGEGEEARGVLDGLL